MLRDLDQDCDDDIIFDDLNDASTPKLTEMPQKPKPKSMKKKLQEEAYKLWRDASDQEEKRKAKAKGELEAFGYLNLESMEKLDYTTQHIVQYQCVQFQ